jgi:4'-phosphopantetheinyl transferase
MWLMQLLTPEEREQAARFHFERDQNRFAITRGILRVLLAKYTSTPPEDLRFERGPYGKPALARECGADAFHFNVSHSGIWALLAIARSAEVGVDVEKVRADVDLLDVAQAVFSPREFATLRALPDDGSQREAFFACWSRKEAYIKAVGMGVALGLDTFDVSIKPGKPAALLYSAHESDAHDHWTLIDLEVEEGYHAALAIRERQCRILSWDGENSLVASLIEAAHSQISISRLRIWESQH